MLLLSLLKRICLRLEGRGDASSSCGLKHQHTLQCEFSHDHGGDLFLLPVLFFKFQGRLKFNLHSDMNLFLTVTSSYVSE